MGGKIISEEMMNRYLAALVSGSRAQCAQVVLSLLDKGVSIKDIYVSLFTASLYRVGEMWQNNLISVAQEHLATSVTESLFSLIYPRLFDNANPSSPSLKAVVSCVANEFHQIGGKIVADILETHSVNSLFLGANTPINDLLDMLEREKPDILALSVAMTPNLPVLSEIVDKINAKGLSRLDIIAGGRAFASIHDKSFFKGVKVLGSIDELEAYIEKRN